jgi:phosphoribosylaminoimidazolecarboxamide formyltransferase / IMP cyclohydrolase
MNKTAVISVWNKSGLIPLAQKLVEEGWELIASGGTARVLQEAGVDVIPVEEITGEPEMFDGRVKTLHPAVHAGILAPGTEAAREELEKKSWRRIGLVVVNLYPFQSVIQEEGIRWERAVEFIDIGGSALMRAGAKNHQQVTVLMDPEDYPDDLRNLEELNFRRRMARKAFQISADYDRAISRYFGSELGEPEPQERELFAPVSLRYGENPHQDAVFYPAKPGATPFNGKLLGGKPLSYNNLLDLDGALRSAAHFQHPAVVVVKHTSPCGIAAGENVEKALPLAVASDPVSAFGSVIACNREVNVGFADALGDLFLECLAAPAFTENAKEILARRESLRLLQIPSERIVNLRELKSISGGYLEQDIDQGDPGDRKWQVVTGQQPSDLIWTLLRFAWRAVIDVKSNAVLLAAGNKNERYTVGIGGGQPNRVDCVRIAGERAGDRAAGSVLASDAFFPFPDGIQQAASLGVTAVIQPGGSIRDNEVIKEADRLGVAMVFTGTRHFRH